MQRREQGNGGMQGNEIPGGEVEMARGIGAGEGSSKQESATPQGISPFDLAPLTQLSALESKSTAPSEDNRPGEPDDDDGACSPMTGMASGAPGVVGIVPNLSRSNQIMESRKSIRRWRGTSQPTRPGMTWFLFGALMLSLFWLTELSGNIEFPPGSPCLEDVDIQDDGIILWMVSFGVAFEYSESRTADRVLSELVVLLVLAAIFFFAFVIIRAQVYYRLTVGVWIVALFLIISIVSRVSVNDIEGLTELIKLLTGPILLLLIIVFAVYIGVVVFLWKYLPVLQLKHGWFLPKVWSSRVFAVPAVMRMVVQEVYQASAVDKPFGSGISAIKITYSSWIGSLFPAWVRKMMRMNYLVTYSGEVDDDGRPHGYGEWNDTYYHGEVLQGWWNHGLPAGPFRSRESGSGAGFVRLLVPYIRNRTDDVFGNNGRIDFGPLSCGILEVECCVAGVFFREYPKASMYHAVTPSGSLTDDIKEVLGTLIALPQLQGTSAVMVQADMMRGLLVSSHNKPLGTEATSVTISVLARDGSAHEPWKERINFANRLAKHFAHRPVEDDSDEEEDFHTGAEANPCCEFPVIAMRKEEQEEGTASLPSTDFLLRPKLQVEGWAQCSFTEEREALVFIVGFNSSTDGSAKILAQLLALGNFPPYLKPFIFSWPGGSLAKFGSAQIQGAESDKTTEDLKSFLLALGDAGIRTIHIMTHSMGVRVLTASIPKLEEVFGTPLNPVASNRHASGTSFASEETAPAGNKLMELSTVLMLNPEVGRHEFIDCYARRLSAMCPCISLYADAQDVALFGSELMTTGLRAIWPERRKPDVYEDLSKASEKKQKSHQARRVWWEYSVGRISKDLLYADGSLVDIDVIQTTYLGANVQNTRHNAFSLNRELVDDLRDVIVNKQRAYQRFSRLQYRGGNRYNFLVAPTHVVNE